MADYFSVGVILLFLLGAGMLVSAGEPVFLRKYKMFHRLFRAAICVVCGMALLLASYGSRDTAGCGEDALIVLGARMRDDNSSGIVFKRLERAMEYHRINPGALIVVTGGKRTKTGIPEGEAMGRWLVKRGVPEGLIIVEGKSKNTHENFVFTKVLLDERLGEGEYTAAFATNAFHIYRSSRLAKQSGIAATHVHAGINWLEAPAAYLRECAAVVRLWILKK
jgi:uncharacterized SAM-binding protein YcdF (DUF218 family)